VRRGENLVLPRLFVQQISGFHAESADPSLPEVQPASGEAAPGQGSPRARVRIPYAPLKPPAGGGFFVVFFRGGAESR
jgi:hypothetical protein